MTEIYRLALHNEPSEIGRMAAWLDEIVGPLHLPDSTKHAVQLCLEEVVTNVIFHAFEPGAVHEVRVSLWRDAAGLHAEVADDGRPFDPLAYEPAPAPKDLESAAIGGLGIKLIRSFAAGVAWRRVDGLNRLEMSFPIPWSSRPLPKEIGGRDGPEPTRYGDWEVNGRCTDF